MVTKRPSLGQQREQQVTNKEPKTAVSNKQGAKDCIRTASLEEDNHSLDLARRNQPDITYNFKYNCHKLSVGAG